MESPRFARHTPRAPSAPSNFEHAKKNSRAIAEHTLRSGCAEMRSADANGAEHARARIIAAHTRMYAAHTPMIATPAQDIDTPLLKGVNDMVILQRNIRQTDGRGLAQSVMSQEANSKLPGHHNLSSSFPTSSRERVYNSCIRIVMLNSTKSWAPPHLICIACNTVTGL